MLGLFFNDKINVLICYTFFNSCVSLDAFQWKSMVISVFILVNPWECIEILLTCLLHHLDINWKVCLEHYRNISAQLITFWRCFVLKSLFSSAKISCMFVWTISFTISVIHYRRKCKIGFWKLKLLFVHDFNHLNLQRANHCYVHFKYESFWVLFWRPDHSSDHSGVRCHNVKDIAVLIYIYE